ncbi:MAG TPA: proton-conducting transporter membrane subunit [Terriglobales bacterium]|nr:proton-conducting transporter membrane subunit [Terriglobales bacterium]
MMSPEQAVFAGILVCVAGAAITLLAAPRKALSGWLALAATAASCILIFAAAGKVLRQGPSAEPLQLWASPLHALALRLHVDGLAVVFLVLASGIALPAALYSIRYMQHYADYGVGRYYPCFLLFLAAMYGLLSATDMMWGFFVFWQLMTLPGYVLIRFEYRQEQNRRASRKFLVMMEVACAAIMIGAALLAPGQAGLRFEFAQVSANLPSLLSARPGTATLAFTLFLLGFGIKMGMWPFGQMWLPEAHPAAPSPVSAMLSGVMIKTGVYGLMRYFLWLVPATAQDRFPLARWGMVVAILGTVTLFSGTMQALKQEQSKRLLAFHSIGQIGYILLGTGICMVLLPAGPVARALAVLGLFGALFHVLNHGLFKGLLFLNAGSMLHATGTQDLNRMGGLMKYMPLTGITVLVGSLSISGVPLFNGFASKWTIFVAAIQGAPSARYLALCAVIAILTSALTLASFVKFFGASFLSRASDLVKEKAGLLPGRQCVEMHFRTGLPRTLEVNWSMQAPQVLLALLCVLLGVAPGLAFGFMQRALAAAPQATGGWLASAIPVTPQAPAVIAGPHSAAIFVPLALAVVLAVTFLIAFGISKLGSAKRRAAAPWLCGYAPEAECQRYIAHNFYGEIKRHFHWVGGAQNGKAVTVKGRVS